MSRTSLAIRSSGMVLVLVVGLTSVSSAQGGGGGLTVLEKSDYGPYGAPITLLVNSADEWKHAMEQLEAAGALAVVPGPDAPTGVDWENECVVLVASGTNGSEPNLLLIPIGGGEVKLDADYSIPSANSGGEALPYQLAKVNKRTWLSSRTVVGAKAPNALPLSGPDFDPTSPAGALSWGRLKALYH